MTKKSNNTIWVLWIFVSVIGSTLGFTFAGSLADSLGDYNFSIFYILLFVVTGFFMSFGQWIIIRTRVVAAWRWMVVTTLGLPICFVIAVLVIQSFASSFVTYYWLVSFVTSSIAGLLIGLPQSLVFSKSIWRMIKWSLVSSLSWGICLGFIDFIFDPFLLRMYDGFLFYPTFGLLVGGIVGLISGAFVGSTLISEGQARQLITSQNAS